MEKSLRKRHPKLHKYLFTVTTVSKIIALILFVALPFIGFYFGMKYQENLTALSQPRVEIQRIPNLKPMLKR